MIWSLIAQGVMLVLDLLTLRYSANQDKALEVLILRQQIRILELKYGKTVSVPTAEQGLIPLGFSKEAHSNLAKAGMLVYRKVKNT